MFINKENCQPNENFQKMSSYVNGFLKTELTGIPSFFTSIFGDYYNNALCNGASWVFAFWCILHILFDTCIDALLKKLRYREYARIRLKNSLWYLGFFGTCLVYSVATLDQNNIEFFNIKKVPHIRPAKLPEVTMQNNNFMTPVPIILGHVVISTFFLHSALWETTVRGDTINAINYLLLFLFTVLCYITKANEIFEVSMKLIACISIARLALEFTRCYFMSSVQKNFLSKLTAIGVYSSTFLIYVVVHLIIIPLVCIVRLGLSIMSEKPNTLLLFLFFILIFWLGIEIYHSVLFRFVNHWMYHQTIKPVDDEPVDGSRENLNKVEQISTCQNTLFECSLFLPRDDLAYHIKKIRMEIEERKKEMMSLRKPKNMLFQTLKCMVAIKRKLSEKTLKASPEKDELDTKDEKDSDSESSEYNEAHERASISSIKDSSSTDSNETHDEPAEEPDGICECNKFELDDDDDEPGCGEDDDEDDEDDDTNVNNNTKLKGCKDKICREENDCPEY